MGLFDSKLEFVLSGKVEIVHRLVIDVDAALFAVARPLILGAINQLEQIMPAIDDLEREVTEDTDVKQSAINLLNNLKTALDEAIASGSMAKVQQLANRLNESTDSLAAAVAANTPAETPAEPGTGEPGTTTNEA